MNQPVPHEVQAARVAAFGRWMILCLVVALSATVLRVGQLKLAPAEKLAQLLGPPTSTHVEMARRGDIIDVRGRVVATSTVGYRLFADPKLIDDPLETSRQITERIGGNAAEFAQLIRERDDRRYAVLSQRLEGWQVDAMRSAGIAGIGLEPRLIRESPHGTLGDLVVGLVGFDHSGLAGVEAQYNELLSPHDGRLTYLRDAMGRPLWIEPDGYQAKSDGDNIRLSIDLVVQEIVQRELDSTVTKYNAGGGRAIVMDTQTGDILAIADVLNPRRGWSEVARDPIRDQHPSLGRNRCVTDPYEPGSTFKPFVWAAATQMNKARPDELLPTPSSGVWVSSKGRHLRDVHAYGPVSWRTVLVKSINSGMAMVGERMSATELQRSIRAWGFGTETACGLPGESAGIVTSKRNWSHYTQTSVPMGQEIGVTAVQMVRAFSAFCRDGSIVEPRIVIPPGGSPATGDPVQPVVSEPIALMTRDAMRGVMTEGTGRASQSELYEVFGKSGTAQLPIPKDQWKKYGKGYFQDRYVASFIAGAPFRNPRIVVLVVIDDPDKRKGHFGGLTAGPCVRDIVDQTLTYLGIAPDAEPKDPKDPKDRHERLAAR